MNYFVREESAVKNKILIPIKIAKQFSIFTHLCNHLTAHCGLKAN